MQEPTQELAQAPQRVRQPLCLSRALLYSRVALPCAKEPPR
jgi:hypothetical protein